MGARLAKLTQKGQGQASFHKHSVGTDFEVYVGKARGQWGGGRAQLGPVELAVESGGAHEARVTLTARQARGSSWWEDGTARGGRVHLPWGLEGGCHQDKGDRVLRGGRKRFPARGEHDGVPWSVTKAKLMGWNGWKSIKTGRANMAREAWGWGWRGDSLGKMDLMGAVQGSWAWFSRQWGYWRAISREVTEKMENRLEPGKKRWGPSEAGRQVREGAN